MREPVKVDPATHADTRVWHQFQRNAEGKVSELVNEVDGTKTVLKRLGLAPKATVNDFSWLLGTWKHKAANSSWRKLMTKRWKAKAGA